MIDVREYESLARETGAYKDIEIDILKETLLDWQDHPGQPYTLLDLRDGKILAGFAIFAKAPNTDFTYDIRDICIERAYIGKGVSLRLMEMLEEEARRLESSAILRLETSRRKEDAMGRGSLAAAGFATIGHIADFYATGDDYYIFAKHVIRQAPPPAEAPTTTDSPAATKPDTKEKAP
jgi:GNAT superfamily N-acetyltransferase